MLFPLGHVSSLTRNGHRRRSPACTITGLLCVCCTVMLVVLGLSSCSGRNQSSERDTDVSPHESDSTSSGLEGHASLGTSSASYIDGVPDLRELSQSRIGFALRAELHRLLAKSNEEQVLALLRQAVETPRASVRESMQELIVGRLAALNPKEALTRVTALPTDVHEHLTTVIFEEWSLSDLDGAVTRARSLDGLGKLAALRGILRSRDDLTLESRMEIAASLGLEHYVAELVDGKGISESNEFPEIAWYTIVNDSYQDIAQIGKLIRIAEEWTKLEGLDVLEEIITSINDSRVAAPILKSVLHEFMLDEPQATFNKALELDRNRDIGSLYGWDDYVATSVVRSWATVDPRAALDSVASLGSGSLRSLLQNTVIETWGRSNPEELLSNLDLFPEQLHVFGTESALVSIARAAPEEAARLLLGLNVGNRLIPIAHTIAKSWSNRDVHAALDWVRTSPQLLEAQSELLPVILGTLASSDPQRAIDIALQHPNGMEVNVITYLARSEPQQAAALLTHIREDAHKLTAYTSVGRSLIRSGEVDQSLKMAEDLEGSERTEYQHSIVGLWALTDPEDLYNKLDSLPNKEIRATAIVNISSVNQFRRVFSDEEMKSMVEKLGSE